MPLAGSMKVCLFAACPSAFANLSIPLSVVGAGGSAAVTGLANFTVYGAPWTTGTVSVGLGASAQTRMGFRHGPASGTSSTAMASGSLQLVTPIHIFTGLGSPVPARR